MRAFSISWQSLVLLNTILLGAAMLVMRVQMKDALARKSTYAINFVLYLTLVVTALMALPWLGHIDPTVLKRYWWRLVIGGFAFSFVNITTYKMLQLADAGTVSILNMLNAVSTVILAALALDERLSILQLIGTALLLTFTAYAVASGSERRYESKRRPLVIYAVLTAVLYAIAAVNEKWLIGHMSLASYAAFGWGWQFLAAALTTVVIQPKAFKTLADPHICTPAVEAGFLRSFGGLAFVMAQTRSNEIGLLTAISNSRVLIVVLFAALVLGERAGLARKLLAGAGAVASLFFVLL